MKIKKIIEIVEREVVRTLPTKVLPPLALESRKGWDALDEAKSVRLNAAGVQKLFAHVLTEHPPPVEVRAEIDARRGTIDRDLDELEQ